MAKALAVVAAVWVTTVYWFSFLAVSTISRTGTSASSSSSSSISVGGRSSGCSSSRRVLVVILIRSVLSCAAVVASIENRVCAERAMPLSGSARPHRDQKHTMHDGASSLQDVVAAARQQQSLEWKAMFLSV